MFPKKFLLRFINRALLRNCVACLCTVFIALPNVTQMGYTRDNRMNSTLSVCLDARIFRGSPQRRFSSFYVKSAAPPYRYELCRWHAHKYIQVLARGTIVEPMFIGADCLRSRLPLRSKSTRFTALSRIRCTKERAPPCAARVLEIDRLKYFTALPAEACHQSATVCKFYLIT